MPVIALSREAEEAKGSMGWDQTDGNGWDQGYDGTCFGVTYNQSIVMPKFIALKQ